MKDFTKNILKNLKEENGYRFASVECKTIDEIDAFRNQVYADVESLFEHYHAFALVHIGSNNYHFILMTQKEWDDMITGICGGKYGNPIMYDHKCVFHIYGREIVIPDMMATELYHQIGFAFHREDVIDKLCHLRSIEEEYNAPFFTKYHTTYEAVIADDKLIDEMVMNYESRLNMDAAENDVLEQSIIYTLQAADF